MRALPAGLAVTCLDLTAAKALEALPAGLRVHRLVAPLDDARAGWLAGLRCFDADLRGSSFARLPGDLVVENRLDLTGCQRLRHLPDGLRAGTLVLRGCRALVELPEDLEVSFLDVSGCDALTGWPYRARFGGGRLAARDCAWLRELPPWLSEVAQLDLRGCAGVHTLPAHVRVSGWIDVAGTRLAALPPHLAGVGLRWRGLAVDERIAFRPQTITASQVLEQPNLERRRVLLERMGFERFVAESNAEVLDRDTDAGGERRLVRVVLKREEPLVCVVVRCPSTGRQYVLRVPPATRTCHQAVAWLAGFDDPDLYRPIAES